MQRVRYAASRPGWRSSRSALSFASVLAVSNLTNRIAAGAYQANTLALDAGASDDATRSLGDQIVPWVLHDQAAVRAVLAGAGLADVEAYLRLGPVDRLYVLARRPTAP